MKRFYFSKLISLIAILSSFCSSVTWAQSVSLYTIVGTYTYTVAPGAVSLSIDMAGAQGGTDNAGSVGGKGGRVLCTLAVTGGQILTVNVGGMGTNGNGSSTVKTGGANGAPGGGAEGGNGYYMGAGGGGSSDIRTGGTALTNRIIVGGAGGGPGQNCNTTAPAENGGDGGGLIGGSGWECGIQDLTIVGQGGTQLAGGFGSTGYTHTDGVFGHGGGNTLTQWVGGGGGGWYGGGSGQYGGGGGGSSYYDGAGVTGGSTTSAYQVGNGYVSITQLCNSTGTISGPTAICMGSTATLTESSGGGTWSSSNTDVAIIGSASGLITTVGPGTTTITYTVSNPCGALATKTLTVNLSPSSIGGTFSVCSFATTSLSSGPSGGTWSSSNGGQASVSSLGLVTGGSPGIPTITYTLPGGCNATTPVTVNAGPAPITGNTLICGTGATTTLTDVTTGGTWSSSFTPVASISGVLGTNATILGGVPGTATIGYTLSTGCLATKTVTVNNLSAFSVSGGGAYCAGTPAPWPVGLDGSTSGISYQLFNGATGGPTLTGTGSAISFGIQPSGGTYTVVATNPATGCQTTMTGSATITVNASPTVYVITSHDTGYCVGAPAPHVILGNSEFGVSYQLYLGAAPSGSAITSGGGIVDFGAQPVAGTYTVVATNLSGCKSTMTGSTTIAVNPLPNNSYTVTGGGGYCAGDAGRHVGLSFSASGVNYTLYNGITPVTAATAGSGAGLDFGVQGAPGVYTVKAANAISGCASNMTGSVTITMNPVPFAHNVTGTNSYCTGGAGVHVGLDASEAGIRYQLYNGPAVGSPVNGPGTIDFGIYPAGNYTATGTNILTGCSTVMNGSASVTTVPLPYPYILSGSGHYCADGSGRAITLSGSDYGISYQLYSSGTAVGDPLYGSSLSLNFDVHPAGSYTVVGTDVVWGCTANMSGTITITSDPLPTPYTVTGGGGYCDGSAGKHVGLSFSQVGVNYQLFYNGDPTGLPMLSGSGSGMDFGIYTAVGHYTVIATNVSTGCNNLMSGGVDINMNPLPNNNYTVSTTGASSYCAGDAGIDIMTSGSDESIRYQLYNGMSASGAPLYGTGGGEGEGSGLDFGLRLPAGVYTAIATDTTTGCSSTLTGSVTIVINPLPTVFVLGGGGNYCAGGAGADIILSGSVTGVNYQLNLSGSPLGDPVGGSTGLPIDFGAETGSGVYTVLATDATTQCSVNMSGTPVITILPVPDPHAVTGGGNYCMSGPGKHIGLDGSDAGIHYQLYNGTPSGPYLSGTGLTLDFGLRTIPGTYMVVATNPSTGCSSNMPETAEINVDSLPHVYTIVGGGTYCAGGDGEHIALSYYDEGFNYWLYNGGVLADSIIGGVAPDFGLHTAAGTYTATATNPSTGCTSNMSGSVTIAINSPTIYTVIGGGGYCEGGTGVHVGQSGSHIGVNYQLYNDFGSVGDPVAGTGLPLDFGAQAVGGTYTVVATDGTFGCTANMAGFATVNINPLPGKHTVTGGGRFCAGSAGADVSLNGSDGGISYQLYRDLTTSGLPLTGSEGILDFGLKTAGGNYIVVGTNPTTGCSDTMLSSAVITVVPLPTAYTVTADNYGNYCATDSGLHVRLANSQSGVGYQLYRDGVAVGSVTGGTGTTLDLGLQVIAGTYTVMAHDTGMGCDNNMSGAAPIYIIPLPIVYSVTGGGNYCPGGAGMAVGLERSQAGIWYQLYRDIIPVGTPLYGTGVSLDFGQQPAGNYTIVGNSAITTCPNNMFGTAVVKQDTLQLPAISIQAYPGIGIGVWHIDSLRVFFTNGGDNPTFQWIINNNVIAGATSASFTHHEFFNGDSIVVKVTADGPCGGLTAAKGLMISLHDVGVQQVTSVGSDLKLIPNPNKGTFTVKGTLGSTADEEVSLEVTNMLGQVVYTNKVTAHNGTIEERIQAGSNLANGMYLLNVRSATQNNVIHFVIEQ